MHAVAWFITGKLVAKKPSYYFIKEVAGMVNNIY
jgi:hypothetical protein